MRCIIDKNYARCFQSSGHLLCSGRVVVDNDVVLSQGSNVGNGVAEHIHLYQAVAVGKGINVADLVVIHIDIGQGSHFAQIVQTGHRIVGTVDDLELAVLRPFGQRRDLVGGEDEPLQIDQGGGRRYPSGVVGNVQLGQGRADGQGRDIRQRVVVHGQPGQHLQAAHAVQTGELVVVCQQGRQPDAAGHGGRVARAL